MRILLRRLVRKLRPQIAGVTPNPGATEFEVNNWILSEFVVNRLVPVVGVHPYPLNELMLMAGAVCRFRPSHVFEWGTNIGASARVFYETSVYFRIPLEIHSIDLPPSIDHVEQPGSARGCLVKNRPGVHLHLGDGMETSLGIYRNLPAGTKALFFVDGDHGFDSVRREFEAILINVPDAIVLLHDTFYQSENSGYNTGPYRAVQEVLKCHVEDRAYRTIALNTGLPGMTLVY
jgi:hypothetical protein